MAYDSPMPARALGTLGTLYLVARKTRQDVQSFPIDCERITIGRDYECDIRLYFNDVSKLHAEIVFDLISNQATLHIHGGNGITYTPKDGEPSHQSPPSVLALNHGDTFMLRKKIFRFEYGPEEKIDSPAMDTPTKAPTLESPAKPIRRRASHRLSLVPSGKEFAPHTPMKARRTSEIHGPSRLSHAQAVAEEEQEEMDGPDEDLVDVVEGDEGDRVYLEMKDEDHKSQRAIYNNAFMTPQQKRKAPIPHTDAAPRTRIAAPVFTEAKEPHKTDGTTNESVGQPSPASSRVPVTVALSTPRGPGSLRKSLLLKSARQIWKETQSPGLEGAIENGSVQTRRKSLSPRVGTPSKAAPPPESSSESEEEEEVQHENVLAGVDHADGSRDVSMEDSEDAESLAADVSLDLPDSPLTNVNYPKLRVEHGSMRQDSETYQDEGEQDCNEEDEMNGEEEQEKQEEQEEQEEQEAREDEEMEDGEDEQYDIVDDVHHPALPGTPAAARTLSKFYTPQPRRDLGAPRRSLATMGPAVRFKPAPFTPNFNARPVHIIPRSRVSLGPPSRGPVRMTTPVKAEVVKQEDDDEHDQEEEEDVKPAHLGTPQRAANKAEAKRRRESLAALATPRRLPAPPSGGFRNLGAETPLKPFATPTHPALAATTPRRAAAAVPSTPLDDIKRRLELIRKPEGRRATVGFALPATPAQRPAINTSASYTVAAASKRRVEFTFSTGRSQPVAEDNQDSAENEEDGADTDNEMIDEEGAELHEEDAGTEINMEGVQQDELFDIPADEEENPFVSSTADAAVAAQVDGLVASIDQDLVMTTPLPATAALNDILPQRVLSNSRLSLESSSIVSVESGSTEPETIAAAPISTKPVPATPSFVGLKEMIHAPLPPKTPNFAGLKNLYPTLPSQPATPSFAGIRQLMAEPAQVPPTPSFIGVKDMYMPQKPTRAPVLDGVAELYEMSGHEEKELDEEVEEEVEEEIEDMIEVQEEVEEKPVWQQKKTVASPPKASTSKPSASSRSRRPATVAEVANEPAALASVSAPTKRGRAVKATSSSAKATTSESVPTRRTALTEVAESKSVSSRTRRSATVETEAVELKPTLSRARRAPTVEEEDAPSKPSTSRSRPTRKADPVPPVIDEEVAAPKRSRARTTKKATDKVVLGEADEQSVIEVKEEPTSKPGRAKKAPATKVAEKDSAETSRPSRSTTKKVQEDKENEPAAEKKVVKRTTKRIEVEEVAAPVRVTRSRK